MEVSGSPEALYLEKRFWPKTRACAGRRFVMQEKEPQRWHCKARTQGRLFSRGEEWCERVERSAATRSDEQGVWVFWREVGEGNGKESKRVDGEIPERPQCLAAGGSVTSAKARGVCGVIKTRLVS